MTKIKSQVCEHAEFWKFRADDLLSENFRLNVELQRKDEYIRKLEDQLRVKNNAVEIVEVLKTCLPVKS